MSIKDKITPGRWANGPKAGAGVTGRIKSETGRTIADFYTFSEGISDEEAKSNSDCASKVPEMLDILARLISIDVTKQNELANYFDLKQEAINLLKQLNNE